MAAIRSDSAEPSIVRIVLSLPRSLNIISASPAPLYTIILPELFVNLPNCVPASFNIISALSASRIISPAESIVKSPVSPVAIVVVLSLPMVIVA